MKSNHRPWLRRLLSAMLALALLAACVTPNREPTIRLDRAVRETPGTPRWQQMTPQQAGVRVWRNGQEVSTATGMLLHPGDELETAPQATAVLRYSAHGLVTVAERSRVRVGSLEVFFGRLLAEVRNLFEVRSESVAAAVDGTTFLVEVQARRGMRIAVAEGTVNCRSLTNQWAAFKLPAGRAMLAQFADAQPPRQTAANAQELASTLEWAREIRAAPQRGWCCRDGQTEPGWSNECTSNLFGEQQGLVAAFCRPRPEPAEPLVWCCAQRRVLQLPRSQCYGSAHDSAALAQRACSVIN